MSAFAFSSSEPDVIDLTKPSYKQLYEECVRRTDWLAVVRAEDVNDARVYSQTPVGYHIATQRAFCRAQLSKRISDSRVDKRSRHTRLIGARMHACMQHGVYCAFGRSYSTVDSRPKKRQRKRDYNLSREPARPCEQCEHPPRCNFKACKVWSDVVYRWLERANLVPVAVELDVAWHRIETSTRIDMICVNSEYAKASEKMPPVVVVSIKTVGEGERAPTINYGAPSLRLPANVFSLDSKASTEEEEAPDCEYSRHQLQLMLECITLADSYKMIVQDAHIIYVSYTGSSDAKKVTLEECSAEAWWFDKFMLEKDADRLSERFYALAVYMNSQCDFSRARTN